MRSQIGSSDPAPASGPAARLAGKWALTSAILTYFGLIVTRGGAFANGSCWPAKGPPARRNVFLGAGLNISDLGPGAQPDPGRAASAPQDGPEMAAAVYNSAGLPWSDGRRSEQFGFRRK